MTIDFVSKRLFANCGQNGLVSLMYHSVTPGKSKPSWQWALSLSQFDAQLALLADFGWHTISETDLLSGKPLREKSVLLTFDDGYADNHAAFNALAKRSMVASWFVVAQDIGGKSSWIDDGAPTGLPMLNHTQLLEMHNAGMSIGSHTMSHCRLTQSSETVIKQELVRSKMTLSDLLNTEIESFAYPYGLYNAEILAAVRNTGYRMAFCTCSGFGLLNNDLLQIRRIAIKADDTLSSFARKLAFADNDVSWPTILSYAKNRLADRIRP